MFSLPRNTETPRSRLNDRGDPPDGLIGSFMEPKITSTPLVRDNHLISPPKPRLFSPHKYSLSEITAPSHNNRRNSLPNTNTLGPLLASTKYNVNVSTYEDAKSPGLVSRIVQYSEETEHEKEYQRPATHQAKYSGAGLFPIVHLFKKDLPTLEPRRVTVKLASSDYTKPYNQEYNQKLLEGIIKPGSPSLGRRTVIQGPNNNNSGTRSVLDALKEISRKRLHTNEEFDLNEDDSKRIRTEHMNGDSNKRSRADSPLLDSSPESYSSSGRPQSKRMCVYDEYAASCSSSSYLTKTPESSTGGAKRKSVSISTLTENPKEAKQVKLVTVETQTCNTSEIAKVSESTSTTELYSQNDNDSDETKTSKARESPVKIFDDAPLERIRRNRLMALMGSLAGKDAPLTPKPNVGTVLVEKNKDVLDLDKEKPLVSIMSHNKSHLEKSDKHVHFNIPSSTSLALPAASTSTTETLHTNSVAKSQTPAPPSSPVNLPTSESSAPLSTSKELPVINFTASGDSLKTTTLVPSLQFNLPSSTSVVLPAISTSVTSVSSSTSVGFIMSKGENPKIGGFKFDLPKSVSTTSVASSAMSTTSTSAAQLTFSTTTSKSDLTVAKPAFGVATSSAFPLSDGFVLGSKSSSSTTTTVPSFGLKVTTASSLLPTCTTTVSDSPARIAFGVKSSPSTPSFGVHPSSIPNPASPSFGSSITSAASLGSPAFNTTPTFNFGNANKYPSSSTVTTLGAPTTSTSAPPSYESTAQSKTFSFGTANMSTTSNTSFGSDTKPTFSFGGVKPNDQKSSTAPFSFGTATTTAGAFNNTPTTSCAFGTTAANSSFGTTTTTSTFGTPSVTRTTSSFDAAQATKSSTFGGTSATVIPFTKPTVPNFGQNSVQPSFGATTTTVPASFGSGNNTFGSTNTTNSGSMFGGSNPPAFGTANSTFGSQNQSQNIFGGTAAAQPTSFGASSSANPTFGGASAPTFGSGTATTTTAPEFGTNGSTPVFSFGAKTTTSATTFGTGNTFGATTTASSGFGTTSTPSFGSSGGFGTANATFGASSGTFAANSASTFGTATTTQSAGFGATNTPSFGANTGTFGGTASKPAFGSVAPSSSSATPSFGATAPTTGFGQSNPPSAAFGSNTASAFSKPSGGSFGGTGSSSSGSFGTPNSSFGAVQQPPSSISSVTFNTPTTTQQQSGMFGFGGGSVSTAPPAAKPAGVFSFGGSATSSGDVTKPTFNFTGGAAPPSFGGATSPSFGANNVAVPQFGATGTPQFGAAAAGGAPGTFNIGAGPPASNRGRTTLKSRRRI